MKILLFVLKYSPNPKMWFFLWKIRFFQGLYVSKYRLLAFNTNEHVTSYESDLY